MDTTTPTLDDAQARLLARLMDAATPAADLPAIANAIQVLQTTSGLAGLLPLAEAALRQLQGMWQVQQQQDAEAYALQRDAGEASQGQETEEDRRGGRN